VLQQRLGLPNLMYIQAGGIERDVVGGKDGFDPRRDRRRSLLGESISLEPEQYAQENKPNWSGPCIEKQTKTPLEFNSSPNYRRISPLDGGCRITNTHR